jgi:hypothetical protein
VADAVRFDACWSVAGVELDALAEQARAGLEQRQVADHGEPRRKWARGQRQRNIRPNAGRFAGAHDDDR